MDRDNKNFTNLPWLAGRSATSALVAEARGDQDFIAERDDA